MSKRLDYLFMSNDVCKRLFDKCHEIIDYFYSSNKELTSVN